MPSRFTTILAQIERPAPPAGLFEAVMEQVSWEKKAHALRRRVALFGAATVALTALMVWAFASVRTAMSGSGNLEFLTLFFSDTRVVLANWSTFASSVLESLPAAQLAVFLSVMLCFTFALRALIRDARRAFGGHHHAFNF